MQYYRVKKQYDNKILLSQKGKCLVNSGKFLVAEELYTLKEWEKITKKYFFCCNPADYVEVVEVSKNKIYWFFGARFADRLENL